MFAARCEADGSHCSSCTAAATDCLRGRHDTTGRWGRDLMARWKIVIAGYDGNVLLPNYEQRSTAVLTVGVTGSRLLYLMTRVAAPYIYFFMHGYTC